MVEGDVWYFDRFGAPSAVLRRGREGAADPAPGQAVVSIQAVGVNQADDRYVRGEHFPPKQLPSYAAHEAVGHIVALGVTDRDATEDGSAWAVGDRVALLPMLVDRSTVGALRHVGTY